MRINNIRVAVQVDRAYIHNIKITILTYTWLYSIVSRNVILIGNTHCGKIQYRIVGLGQIQIYVFWLLCVVKLEELETFSISRKLQLYASNPLLHLSSYFIPLTNYVENNKCQIKQTINHYIIYTVYTLTYLLLWNAVTQVKMFHNSTFNSISIYSNHRIPTQCSFYHDFIHLLPMYYHCLNVRYFLIGITEWPLDQTLLTSYLVFRFVFRPLPCLQRFVYIIWR